MTDENVHWSMVLAEGAAIVAAVVEEESVTRAAERLGVPQPTVTRALARLQRDLGVTLVERRGRGVAATAVGVALLPHLRRVLDAVADARAAAAELMDPEAGAVRLGFLHSLGAFDVPALIRTHRRVHPDVQFALRQGARGDVLDALRAGDLDLALVAPPPGPPDDPDDDLAVAPLRSDTLVLAVPVGHRLAGRSRVALSECADEPFVLLTPGHGLRAVTEELFATAGIAPAITFEGEDVSTLRGLVSAGLGVSLLQAHAPGPPVVELAVSAPRAVRTVAAVWHRGRVSLPAARRFRDHVVATGPALLAARHGSDPPSEPTR